MKLKTIRATCLARQFNKYFAKCVQYHVRKKFVKPSNVRESCKVENCARTCIEHTKQKICQIV